MTISEYQEKYENNDHVLIRLTDRHPFFVDKVIVKDGQKRIETNYHIADGVRATYINFEMPRGGDIALEIWPRFMFEVDCQYDIPVFVTNISKKLVEFEIAYKADGAMGDLYPDEVYALYPDELAQETYKMMGEAALKRRETEKYWLTQDEIIKLLNGDV